MEKEKFNSGRLVYKKVQLYRAGNLFPKDKILERIDKIKDMKDDLSLDDLAAVFSPVLADVALTKEELFKKNIVSQVSIDIYEGIHGETKVFNFEKILYVGLLESFLHSGEIGLEEGKLMLQTLESLYKNFENRACDIMLIRKFGVATCLLASAPNEIYLESGAKMVLKVNISKTIEELKLKL